MNLPDALPMDRADAAWLAGLLDGEGCFDAPRNNPRIRVKMSDHDVVMRAAALMGASVHMEAVRADHHLPLMVGQITGERAVSVMRAILPWLGARRSQRCTDLTLAYVAREGRRKGRHLKAAA